MPPARESSALLPPNVELEDGRTTSTSSVLGQVPPRLHRALTMSSLDDASKPRRVAGLLILAYFLIGTVYYHFFALPEHFAFVDAVYFCVTTITTVGYGDTNTRYNEDHSEEDMLFTSFFVLSGVGIVGAALGVVMAYVLDQEDEAARALAKGDDDADARKPRRFVLGRKLSEAESKVFLSAVVIFYLVLFGTVCFKYIEGSSFTRAFYWCCVSVTTVGYGDVYPVTNGGKYFACAYLLVGCATMAKALGDIAGIPLELRRKRNEQAVLDQYGERLDVGEFREILQSFRGTGLDGGGFEACSRTEFVMCMLVKLERVDRSDIRRCVEVFETLDADGSGTLDAKDLEGVGAYEPPAPAPLT